MRTAKTISITLPPEMLERASALAKKEHRTMSELIREALRVYERQNWWDEMNAYGGAKARERSLTEADVVPLVKVVRAEIRKERSARRTR